MDKVRFPSSAGHVIGRARRWRGKPSYLPCLGDELEGEAASYIRSQLSSRASATTMTTKPLQQRSLVSDENRPVQHSKAIKGSMVTQATSRRALGDIGNVLPLPTKSIVRVAEAKVATGAVARSSGNIEIKDSVPQQERVVHPKRVRRHRSGIPQPVIKKEASLTAQLTAWSEPVCKETEEPVPDIDEADKGDHLAVVDYVEDIFSYYRKSEAHHRPSPVYMSLQADINEKMRAILVDWLIELHYRCKLMPETLFLTINVLDRYLSKQSCSRKSLQLVGVTALVIASKYEEIWSPGIEDLEKATEGNCLRPDILRMEKKMLNTLNFYLTVPTPYVFVSRFLKAAGPSDKQMEMLTLYLLELCLMEYAMLKYRPSMLAAAAIYTARRFSAQSPVWTRLLQRHSGYSEEECRDCAVLIVGFHRKSGTGNLRVVYEKYSTSEFGSVASIPAPADL